MSSCLTFLWDLTNCLSLNHRFGKFPTMVSVFPWGHSPPPVWMWKHILGTLSVSSGTEKVARGVFASLSVLEEQFSALVYKWRSRPSGLHCHLFYPHPLFIILVCVYFTHMDRIICGVLLSSSDMILMPFCL